MKINGATLRSVVGGNIQRQALVRAGTIIGSEPSSDLLPRATKSATRAVIAQLMTMAEENRPLRRSSVNVERSANLQRDAAGDLFITRGCLAGSSCAFGLDRAASRPRLAKPVRSFIMIGSESAWHECARWILVESAAFALLSHDTLITRAQLVTHLDL